LEVNCPFSTKALVSTLATLIIKSIYMKCSEIIEAEIAHLQLLKHQFYQSWNRGELSFATLGLYAKEYYPHVYRFPQYLSSIHASCPDTMGIKPRQTILKNLVEEELGENHHPELWLRFSDALGIKREDMNKTPSLQTSRVLADGYFTLTKSSYARGLGAIYAYEGQTPAVSQSKMEGLDEYYGFDQEPNSRGKQFFEVHLKADQLHKAEIAELIDMLDSEGQIEAREGAVSGASLLWGFLDGIMEASA
jgi:pyrroloquinoline-quinone synthase